ncbi:putative regulator of G protein signalling domain [Lyophyllum shimeji]|uniref:Regulator of G protein signalling domain n=1 Tax=Lyophyllum shimeji TaxID=47721 RepID=A0A9P3PZD5_LYOSH|nr:putative regulator of G protein signalling domain [Lyophyllum shimeji]
MDDDNVADEASHTKPGNSKITKPGPTEHVLKVTRVGRPFHQDLADLFATFITAIELKAHKLAFRTYPLSFSTDECVRTLATLKFSQSTRTHDPNDPSAYFTTTTNFMFSMSRPAAMNLAQHFLDAHYIRNAVDPLLNLFKEQSLYTLTPKGLYVLDRFIRKTGIDADHLQHMLSKEIVCSKLFHVERSPAEDEIRFSYQDIVSLFRRFVGPQPNYPPKPGDSLEPIHEYAQRSKGIALMDFIDRGLLGRGTQYQYCFDAVDALEWLCDFTLVGKPEKTSRKAIIFSVSGPGSDDDPSMHSQGEFRCANKTMYQITSKGRRVAGWTKPGDSSSSASSSESDLCEKVTLEGRNVIRGPNHLRFILKDADMRSLFRNFLSERFCEEHVLYWMDVEAIIRKFSVTSSATGGTTASPTDEDTSKQVKADCRRHHEAVLHKALLIYKTYLQPASQHELNTDYTMRNELVKYLETIPIDMTSKDARDMSHRILACDPEQLRVVLQHYTRIQAYTFRIMLTDSLPKFVQTDKYLALLKMDAYLDCSDHDDDTESLHGPSGAYINYTSLTASS